MTIEVYHITYAEFVAAELGKVFYCEVQFNGVVFMELSKLQLQQFRSAGAELVFA